MTSPAAIFERTERLLGPEAMERLARARVLVVGTGGVGAYAVEALARSGVGELVLVDADCVAASNLNRQLPALHSTIGLPKTGVMARRVADINPSCRVTVREEFLEPDGAEPLISAVRPDYVVDAIDSIAPKVSLLAACHAAGVPVIASMGAGGRLDPTQVRYADISRTSGDGLAREVRRRLRRLGIHKGIPTVFSTEEARRSALVITEGERNKVSSFGTVMWLPAQFGLMLAAHVVTSLISPAE